MDAVSSNQQEEFQSVNLVSDATISTLKNKIKQKNWGQAQQIIESQMTNFQDDPDFLFAAAEVYTEIEDFPAALKAYHAVVDLVAGQQDQLFEAHKNMGNIYLKCGDIDAAEERYNMAYIIKKEDENLTVNYGVLAIQKGEYEKAKEKFADVVRTNPGSDLGWVGLALVHRAYSDHELSRACLLRALDENTENKVALMNYYQWCQQDGADANFSYIEEYVSNHPEDQEVQKLAQGLHQ